MALLINETRIPLHDWTAKYLGHYFTAAPSRMHNWLVDELEILHHNRGRKHSIIAPRGSAKTTWISKAYPLYCAVYELEPYTILISNTSIQAEKNLEAIMRELESNPKLAHDFANVVGKGKVWKSSRIETRNHICIEALGMGQKIRGRTFGPHRPTLIVVDDLENDQLVQSPQQREKAFGWLKRAVLPAGTDATNAFVLGTALHRDDVLQNLAKTPGWKSRTFRAIIDEPTRRDLWRDWEQIYKNATNPHHEADARNFYETHRAEMDEGSKLLWPDREPLYQLMCLRTTIGEAAFQAEKQGNPTSIHRAEWSDECFGPTIWFDHWPSTRLKVMALDPSKGGSDKSDYSAFVMLALGTDSLMYVDADLARRSSTQIVEHGLQLAANFRPDAFAVEANQFQALLKTDFERLSRDQGLMLPMYGINNTINKRVRLRTLTPYIHESQFRFKTKSPGAALLVDQLREFPSSRHDDGPDALEMAVRLMKHLLAGESEEQNAQEIVRA